MNIKRIFVFALMMTCLYGVDVNSQLSDSKNKSLSTNVDIVIEVKGMVCSFCAQGIQKNLEKQQAVQSVTVNLTDKTVQLKLKKGAKISDEQLDRIIKHAGYNIARIYRK